MTTVLLIVIGLLSAIIAVLLLGPPLLRWLLRDWRML